MAVIEANKNIFEKEVINSKSKVLVDFNADWCGPCQMLKPGLEKLSEEIDTKIISINVDNEPEIAREYGIMSIPCLIVFENGKEINRSVGFKDKEQILNLIGE